MTPWARVELQGVFEGGAAGVGEIGRNVVGVRRPFLEVAHDGVPYAVLRFGGALPFRWVVVAPRQQEFAIRILQCLGEGFVVLPDATVDAFQCFGESGAGVEVD
jgi:hypothetical protein